MTDLSDWLNRKDIFARNAGAHIIETGEGFARAQMKVGPQHLNGGGVCQGGALFTLADLALAAVMNSDGMLTLSLQTNIVFLAPAREGDMLTATAREVHAHHRAPYYEIDIVSDNGTCIARLTAVAYRKAQSIESIIHEH